MPTKERIYVAAELRNLPEVEYPRETIERLNMQSQILKSQIASGEVIPRTAAEIMDDDQDWSAHNNCAHIPNAETLRNWEDVDAGRNLIGPFATADEAFFAMMAGMETLKH